MRAKRTNKKFRQLVTYIRKYRDVNNAQVITGEILAKLIYQHAIAAPNVNNDSEGILYILLDDWYIFELSQKILDKYNIKSDHEPHIAELLSEIEMFNPKK